MEAVVLQRVGFLEYFCPKQGQDFKPSAAPIYPNIGKVPLPGVLLLSSMFSSVLFLGATRPSTRLKNSVTQAQAGVNE